jgi:hypothetical protein
MTGFPWSDGQVLYANDLDAAFTSANAGIAAATADADSARAIANTASMNATAAVATANAAMPKVGGVVTATGSTASRTLETRFADQVWADDFGAIGDGATDDSAALQAAINSAASRGGGDVWLSRKVYAHSQTLNISTSCIRLRGHGSGAWHDFPTEEVVSAATRLKWTGASGGTMVQIQPAANVTQNIQDNGIEGIYFDSSGTAGYGVRLLSSSGGTYKIAGAEFSQAMLYTGCVTWLSTGTSDFADCMNNDVWLYGININNAGAILVCDGTANADTSFNRFHQVIGNYKAGNALVLQSADNNIFHSVRLFRWPGGSGFGVVLGAGASAALTARANIFVKLSPGVGGVYAEGTEKAASASTNNSALWYDKENSAPDPGIGTGAAFSWSSNNAPIGFRESFLHTANTSPSTSILSDGTIVNRGWTGVIGPSASANITLPTPFLTGAMSVSLTPINHAVTYAATCSATTLTISNGDGSNSTAFWYRVEGF